MILYNYSSLEAQLLCLVLLPVLHLLMRQYSMMENKSLVQQLKKLQLNSQHFGISGNLVVKSKLPPRSGCSLEAVENHP